MKFLCLLVPTLACAYYLLLSIMVGSQFYADSKNVTLLAFCYKVQLC